MAPVELADGLPTEAQPVVAFNPLGLLSDADLWNTQVVLALGCGRSKTSLKGKQKKRFCILFNILTAEANQRGKPSPTSPFSASGQTIA